MPSVRATASAVVAAVAGQHDDAQALARAAPRSPRRVVALIGSATPSRPASAPSTATNIDGLALARAAPRRASASVAGVDAERLAAARALPSATRAAVDASARRPCPVTDSKLVGARRARAPRSRAPATIAAASGCSLPRSRLAASRSSVVSSKPASGDDRRPAAACLRSACRSCRRRACRPSRRRSSASAFLISTPAVAPRPVPTMIDIGVARPSAHGQAMISTATALTSA